MKYKGCNSQVTNMAKFKSSKSLKKFKKQKLKNRNKIPIQVIIEEKSDSMNDSSMKTQFDEPVHDISLVSRAKSKKKKKKKKKTKLLNIEAEENIFSYYGNKEEDSLENAKLNPVNEKSELINSFMSEELSKNNNPKFQMNPRTPVLKNGVCTNIPLQNDKNVLEEIRRQRQNLPIFPVQHRLINAVLNSKCLIIIGETACGKTTQIPQFLLERGISKNKVIAITQPRRVAAITIAERVAHEMRTNVGEKVGYSVRFQDVTSPATKIKYITDGMLLREAISDPLLSKYSIIILDEAHERTIHTDVLFGVVKSAQLVRQGRQIMPLKVIVMSATMDVDHFSKYFNAPVYYLEGRQYPIKMMYATKTQQDYIFSALVTVFQIHQNECDGDILVFCTGQEEIESMVKAVKETRPQLPAECGPLLAYPLYAALPSNLQIKVFKPTPKGSRKVIFSTNIAETSVTIPGIKYVIDTGMVKARTYNPGSGLDLLKTQKISKAQAWQRAGRAGRESCGLCYRMYTKDEYDKFQEHSVPEIQRCSLANVVLQLLAIGIRDIMNFDFMDKPSDNHIEVAIDQLQYLGALKKTNNLLELTECGNRMAAFPLEPKFAKVILTSKDLKCTSEVLTIISLLSIESVFYIPSSKREHAMDVRKKFETNEGDHIMLLKLYKAYCSVKGNKMWCHENFVNQRNMKMAIEIRKQLSDLCQRVGIQCHSSGHDTSLVRKCFASGLFINAAELQKEGNYRTLDTNQKVTIHPSSCLFSCKPAYVVYTELLETSKCYMRNISLVNPDWLMEAAPLYFEQKKLRNVV